MTLLIILALSVVGLMALTALFILGYDFVAGFEIWQRRIHVGRWTDADVWAEAVACRARRWLTHMPVVPRTDNGRLILLDKWRGRYASPTISSWQRAGLVMGLADFGDRPSRDLFIRDGKWLVRPNQVDYALLAYALMSTGSLEQADAQAVREVYDLIKAVKGDNATVPYRRGMKHIRFVDTLGFICPFLVAYGNRYADTDAEDLVNAQLAEYDSMLLPGDVFPPHAIDKDRHLPLGVYDWSRGIGWYILAIVESYRNLASGELRDGLCRRIEALASRMLSFQKPSGGWGASVFIPDSPVEGSGTVLAGLLMVEAFNVSSRREYLEAAGRAIRQLMAITQRGGQIDMCQGDTKGIGNYSTRFGYMPFAQGLALTLKRRFDDANA